MKQQWSVGILMFDHVDVLDYSGPFEVFSLTVRDANQVSDLLNNIIASEDKPFIVKTVSQNELVTTHNGLRLLTDFRFNDHPKFDILIIPGGPLKAIKNCVKNVELLHWIASQHRSGVLVASICSGAFLLAEAGLLNNKKATTNSYAMSYLEKKYPDVEVLRNVRYVDNEDVLTSAGVSAGIDMSLYMVAKLLGEDTAQTTSNTIEYPYFRTQYNTGNV